MMADERRGIFAREIAKRKLLDYPIGKIDSSELWECFDIATRPAPKADSALVGELEIEREAKALAAHFADDAHWWDTDYVGTTDYEDRMEHYAAIAVRTLCPTAALSDRDVVLEEAALHPVLVEIMAEVEKATRKFPTWPTRIIDAGNVVSEEAGELAKACLQVTYEPLKETLEGVRMEAIQTAAMAFRFLCSMDRYSCDPGPQHEQDPLAALKGGVDE